VMKQRGEKKWRVLQILIGASLVLVGKSFVTSTCLDTNFRARDSVGKHCKDQTYDSEDNCGIFDTENFTANQMCCDCGGGFQMDLGAYEQTWDATAPYCYENHRNQEMDEEQRTCAAYYNMDESYCGSADYWDFNASEICCACGGGETRICENTDDGRTNKIGASCIDIAVGNSHALRILNYEACNYDLDTLWFTSSEMCCACGGGRTISPDEEGTCQHESSSLDSIVLCMVRFYPNRLLSKQYDERTHEVCIFFTMIKVMLRRVWPRN